MQVCTSMLKSTVCIYMYNFIRKCICKYISVCENVSETHQSLSVIDADNRINLQGPPSQRTSLTSFWEYRIRVLFYFYPTDMSVFLWINFICPHAKLVDIFSHESDVTSLPDAFTSRSLKTPLCCIIMFHINHGEVLSFTIYTEFSPSFRFLVSVFVTYATAYRTKFPSPTGPFLYTETGTQKLHVIGTVSSLMV